MQYILIGHTRGDELVPSQRVILSEPGQNRKALERFGRELLGARGYWEGVMRKSAKGCYSELWAGAVLSRFEVVPLEPGQAV